ncbi:MAG: DUF2958 domain-containing protein [Clostridia bacterium]|nr:DUF2958 domain-containing protein [Clostridiales bacterium]MBO5005063.1 DUF2958 domain-containing protein [Clostridia bacterium]
MKLMTKELEEEFKKYPIGSQDGLGGQAKVIVKYFNPMGAATWFITEADKKENGDFEMYGFCNLGDSDMAEFGYVMLSELQNIKLPFGMTIERDLYLPKDCTLIQAMKQIGMEIPEYLLENEDEEEEEY